MGIIKIYLTYVLLKLTIGHFFHAFLAHIGPLYGLFGPFLTLFNAKNIIFSPFSKKIPEKLSGLFVKGGVGVPPLSTKEKNLLFFRLIFR